jgi:chemotaxis protein histidine kinase CheA
MNMISGLMQQIGGKVSVGTMPGKFTRLTMSMPPAKRAGTTEAA